MNFRASNLLGTSFLSASALLVACGSVASGPTAAPGDASKPDAPHAVSLLQRTSRTVPGTDDRLAITIGDITRGRVFVTLVDRTSDTTLIDWQPLYVGDTVGFRHDGGHRVLGLSRLVNRLLGDDDAIFHLGKPEAVAEQQVRHVEDMIANARIQFVVAGSDCDSEAAARAVHDAWMRFEPKLAADFLDALERTPATDTGARDTDSAYAVRIGDGVTPLSTWLRKRRARPPLLQPSRFASETTDR